MLYLALYLLVGFIGGSIAIAVSKDYEEGVLGLCTFLWPMVLLAGLFVAIAKAGPKLGSRYISWLLGLRSNTK